MLGTGFLINNNGHIVTTKHVVGNDDKNLVVLFPHIDNLNSYQDLSNNSCQPIPVKVKDIDPFKDIAILESPNIRYSGSIPPIGSFDNIDVGEMVEIFGFPHCIHGRRALTLQRASIGAKVLLTSSDIKSKHAVINIQSRPGQSGSLVFSARNNCIAGILIGAWAPITGGGISLGGINPQELHQTTHCISAEYIKEML
jgi:hypothetical protein